uniref:hypothetical protein n=1 Tax=Okeania sp. SIO2F4 TaxID=2607790 RepID=UPI0025E9B73D|nr:hypothetical protein [Okeania sp. SIO2F4]
MNCNDFPRDFGKGYGECLLIEKGLEKSRLINTVSHFAKITGRIYLKNMTQILESVREDYDCLCEYKDQGWRIIKLWGVKGAKPYCDNRFLVFSNKFYLQFIRLLHQQHQERCFYIETQFYEAFKQLEKEQMIISIFLVSPDFQGIAGHFKGKDYSSKKERMKFLTRWWTRKLIPSLHL